MDLQKRHDELETKSKSNIRVLVKEVKFFRSIQEKLKDDLNQYLKEKSELEAQLLARDGYGVSDVDEINNITDDDEVVSDDQIRKMLLDIIIDNTTLRKRINSVVRCALKTTVNPLKDNNAEVPPRKSFLSIFWRTRRLTIIVNSMNEYCTLCIW